MKQEQFLTRLQVAYNDCVRISRAKNSDYAGQEDAFLNFRRSSEISGVPVERGILVRMSDKMTRIRNLMDRPPEVRDESLLDTLNDLANYSMILRIWLENRNEETP